MKLSLVFAVLLFVPVGTQNLRAQFAGSKPVPDQFKEGFDSITADQASQWLHLLAGPEFAGRGTGQAGYAKAAHWVAGKCAEFGLEPMGDGGTYFQMLPMSRITVDEGGSKMSGPNGLDLAVSGNLSFNRFADQNEVAGDVVFLNLVGANPTLDANISLRDKIVIYNAENAGFRAITRLIAAQGPAAALRIVDSVPRSSQLLKNEGRTRSTSLSGSIARSAAEKIAKAVNGKPEWAQVGKETTSFAGTGQVKINLLIRQSGAAVPNVIAWLEGSDPMLRDEYIVIGSHLDHLGSNGDTVFPGADDNGSGSTAVLSIARAMTQNPVRPKRSVLFMWFAAEESGLVGSAYYCDHPILPVEKMVCMFNIDMVGRNEEKEGETSAENENSIHLIGSKKGDLGLHDVIMAANDHVQFNFEYDEEGVFGRSDQANFYNKGASVAFLFGGFHPDYHQPTDKPEKINYNKIASAARLYYMAVQLASEHGPFKRPAAPAPR